MLELPGKEVSEAELLPGIRYWIVSRSAIHSAVFSQYFRNIATIPRIAFVDAYLVEGENAIFPQTIFTCRLWYPYAALHRYYAIRRLTLTQKGEISKRARHLFEMGIRRIVSSHTTLSMDLAIHIAKYASME